MDGAAVFSSRSSGRVARDRGSPIVDHLVLFSAMGVEGWRPTMADPSLLGWITAAAYFGVALLCEHLWWIEAPELRGGRLRRPRFWLFAAGLFTLLGAAKLLNLQGLLMGSLRGLAKSQDWYADRRLPQLAFVVLVGLLTLGAAAGLAWMGAGKWRRELRRHLLVAAGGVLLLGFLAIRAVSLHQVDAILYATTVGGVRWNALIELALVALIALGTFREIRAGGA